MTLLQIYVFIRLHSLPFFNRRVRRYGLIAAGVGFWLIFFSGRLYGGNEYGIFTAVLEVAGMHTMAAVFLLAVGFFAADLVCGFGFLFSSAKHRIRTAGLAVGIILVVVAHIQGLRAPAVEKYDVVVEQLPAGLDGTTIAVMSDLHVGEMMIGECWLADRIYQLMALNPDCIVLVGDLFEHGANPSDFVPVMRRLTAPLGVWAVRGNHDRLRPGRRDVTGEILAGAGIRLFENEWAKITDGLVIAGIDDLTSSSRRPGEGDANMARALTGLPEGTTIFLSHTPWLTDRVSAAGTALMISGHTHNGQIWPFSWLVKSRYPFLNGRYNINEMTLLVSRGTGTWGPRLRLWKPGEISLITLRTPAS